MPCLVYRCRRRVRVRCTSSLSPGAGAAPAGQSDASQPSFGTTGKYVLVTLAVVYACSLSVGEFLTLTCRLDNLFRLFEDYPVGSKARGQTGIVHCSAEEVHASQPTLAYCLRVLLASYSGRLFRLSFGSHAVLLAPFAKAWIGTPLISRVAVDEKN